MTLARPIPLPHDRYRFLLQRDTEIPVDLIPRLKRMGVVEVWVRHRGLEFLEDLVDEELAEHQRELYGHVRANFEMVMRNSTVELDLVGFEKSIGELFGYLKQSSKSHLLLEKLGAFDNYLMSHSTNVCYLALLLGMKLDRYLIDERRHKSARDAKDLHLLGLGCLLHDIGKMRIPPEILNKPGRLTDDEMAEMRRHPVYGFEMVRGSVPSVAVQVVLNHHQRFDGQGYPPRVDRRTGEELPPLTGRQIPIFSRIALAADVYDAATSRRCYSSAKLPVQVIHEMQTFCRGFFDPVVMETFYRTVPAFPIGQMVALDNGAEAVVVDFNAEQPVRPKVQCIKDPAGETIRDPGLEEIDLALYPDLQIVEAAGQDVREYVAALESAEAEPVLA